MKQYIINEDRLLELLNNEKYLTSVMNYCSEMPTDIDECLECTEGSDLLEVPTEFKPAS